MTGSFGLWLLLAFVSGETPATPPAVPPAAGVGDIISTVIAPILGTGIVGALFLMVIFRIKIMPTYVHEEAKAAWEKQLADKDADIDELKAALKDSNEVYTQQVIPTLTRVLDAERELVELRRDEAAERRRRER